MRIFMERSTPQPQLAEVRCNSCGQGVNKNDVGYLDDHVSLSKTWGYHSPYDGEAHDIDLCVSCYQDWITRFEIPPRVG
ncbi:MAG: hypothetical protein FWB91_13170 [Defluviitaleaceae bacterium]|nr:hypothetical protein [Defluviitaleaceae bacterium]